MSIRPLQRSDIAVAKDLLKQLGYDMAADELLLRLRCVLAANGHYAACAEHAGRVVGLVHVFERPALEKPSEAVVQALVVDNEARGKGVGRTLMAAAEQWAKMRGLKYVVLHTRIDRDEAQAFYEQIGYERAAASYFMRKSLTAS
jgi:ribosomal protein S18 acetylase RimI-like enzyme